MLVIPRSKDQGMVIKDNIIVTVVDILDDEVLISIEHPDDVSIEQSELLSVVGLMEEEPVAV
jgi:carbon storage regulator CsrA